MTAPIRLAPDSADYPMGLHDLEEPPSLWLRGSTGPAGPAGPTGSAGPTGPAGPGVGVGVAVVGTRRCTRYGVDLAESFGAVIARAGWTTVSGLARGIDTAAHRGCLRVSGHAIAVLGSGIDVCYPKENQAVYDRILELGGGILSEYSPGTPPDRWRFPARNRIIAAMSAAIVVVEAAVTGGALITARLGAEMGRPVFVVPGDVDREMSEGCNRLIRDGAHPVLGSADLVEELSLVVGPPAALTDTTHGIPAEGIPVGDLPEIWSLTVTESLIKLGRLEMEGRVKRLGDYVVPA